VTIKATSHLFFLGINMNTEITIGTYLGHKKTADTTCPTSCKVMQTVLLSTQEPTGVPAKRDQRRRLPEWLKETTQLPSASGKY
jgi:hypothetical protein